MDSALFLLVPLLLFFIFEQSQFLDLILKFIQCQIFVKCFKFLLFDPKIYFFHLFNSLFYFLLLFHLILLFYLLTNFLSIKFSLFLKIHSSNFYFQYFSLVELLYVLDQLSKYYFLFYKARSHFIQILLFK